MILIAKENNEFEALMPYQTGIKAIADARDVASFDDANGIPTLIIANNDNFYQTYKLNK